MLDAKTLFACLMVAELAGGAILAFLLLFWKHPSSGSRWSAGLWSMAYIIGGIGTLLLGLRGTLPDAVTLVLANFLILFGTGLRRSAIASFFDVPKRFWVAMAVGGLWLVLCLVPQFRNSLVARVNFNEAMMVFLVAWTIWISIRLNGEKLYTPVIYVISSAFECCAYAGMALYFSISTYPDYLTSFQSFALPYLLLAVLVSMVLSMISVVAMIVERSLRQYQQQAQEDALTGLPNRRAFFQRSEALKGKLAKDKQFAVVVFDLEEVKSIKQTYGRAMGDAILKLFGSVCREAETSNRVPGRLSEDEFALFCCGAEAEEMETLANRLMRRFSVSCHEAADGKLKPEVSTGIALANSEQTVERALEIVDRAVRDARKDVHARVKLFKLDENGRVQATQSSGYARLTPGHVSA
ncbi:GGDEF domain-containing protein [Roseibium sp. SCPC15]|uniref:GGDEF domain-containing protein n=1 Tax=Roseibium sp. SCP15 TaxID=3141376 RepID=UPI00333BEE80